MNTSQASSQTAANPAATTMTGIFNDSSYAAMDSGFDLSDLSDYLQAIPQELIFDAHTQALLEEFDDDLDAHIQGLPQELQDMILLFTGVFEIPLTVTINEPYKLPVALQLNRKIRDKFSKEYYDRVIFEWKIPKIPTNGFSADFRPRSLVRWFRHLRGDQQSMLRHLQITETDERRGRSDEQYWKTIYVCVSAEELRRLLVSAGNADKLELVVGLAVRKNWTLVTERYDGAGELLGWEDLEVSSSGVLGGIWE